MTAWSIIPVLCNGLDVVDRMQVKRELDLELELELGGRGFRSHYSFLLDSIKLVGSYNPSPFMLELEDMRRLGERPSCICFRWNQVSIDR